MPDENNWTAFKVGEPSKNPNWSNTKCCPFFEVSHIAHVNDAIRILEDGVIQSAIVSNGRLRSTRTCVSWVSPNTWKNGSFYGNVEFNFDWNALVSKKMIYWVEPRKEPHQEVVRLLLSEENFTDGSLKSYDQTKGDGPLWHDIASGKWYFNEPYTNEYMIAADLTLDKSCRISFCDHHPEYCSKFEGRAKCPECIIKSADAAATILARMIGANLKNRAWLLSDRKNPKKAGWSLSTNLLVLHSRLEISITKTEPNTGSDAFPSLIRSMCLAYSLGQETDVKALGALFPNRETFKKIFFTVVEEFLGDIELE